MMLFIKKAVQDIRKNRFLNAVTVITIALSILIISAFALFLINTNELMNSWKKGIRIMAYLKDGTPMAEIPGIERKIRNMYGVKEVLFISKEDALKQLKDQMGKQESILENLKENPLPDSFEIRMIPASQSWEKVETLSNQIGSMKQVDDVEYGQKWLGRFTNVFNLFRLASFGLGFLFFFATVFFVGNTIRLVLYSRREEIEIMRLVGATNRFIKIPFYIEGIIQGALGGVIGLAALFILFIIISSNVEQDFSFIYFTIRFLPLDIMLYIFISSMLVGCLGCYLSMKQYLKV